jgi:hypothetical protein
MREITLLFLIGTLSFLIPCSIREAGIFLVDNQLSEVRSIMDHQDMMFRAMADAQAAEAR